MRWAVTGARVSLVVRHRWHNINGFLLRPKGLSVKHEVSGRYRWRCKANSWAIYSATDLPLHVKSQTTGPSDLRQVICAISPFPHSLNCKTLYFSNKADCYLERHVLMIQDAINLSSAMPTESREETDCQWLFFCTLPTLQCLHYIVTWRRWLLF